MAEGNVQPAKEGGGIAKLLAGPEYVTVEDDDAVTELYAGSASPPVERKPSEWLDFDATAITDDHAEAAATHADILDISCGWPVAEAAAGKDSGKEPTDKGDSGPRSGEKYFGAVKSLQTVSGPEQLEALPFKPPTVLGLLGIMMISVFQVIQFTITMFITMLIARGQRAVIDRDDNSKVVAFDSLLGLLLVMYPLVNMGAQMLLSGEIMLRRFMYYRLLSLQVLVDWDNTSLTRSWYFIYFMTTWLLLNVWAVYGVVALWPEGAPWVVVVIVNSQNLLMLVCYARTSVFGESNLVTINHFMENAPMYGRRLLKSLDVVREECVRETCRACWRGIWHRRGKSGEDFSSVEFDLLGLRGKAIQTSNVHIDLSASKAEEQDAACAACGGGLLQWVKSRPKAAMDHMYATIHMWHVALSSRRHSPWPYPRDLPQIRLLLAVQVITLVMVLVVEAVAVVLFAGGITMPQCMSVDITDGFGGLGFM